MAEEKIHPGMRVKMTPEGERCMRNTHTGWFRRSIDPERSLTGTVMWASEFPTRVAAIKFDSRPDETVLCFPTLIKPITEATGG